MEMEFFSSKNNFAETRRYKSVIEVPKSLINEFSVEETEDEEVIIVSNELYDISEVLSSLKNRVEEVSDKIELSRKEYHVDVDSLKNKEEKKTVYKIGEYIDNIDELVRSRER